MARTLALLVAALAVAPVAHAQDYPKLRAGLWEMARHSDRPNDPGQRTTICLDPSVQREMYESGLGAMSGMCSKHDFHLKGSRGEADFVCNLGGSTMHSKSVMTIDGDTAYRTEIDTTYDPPFMGQTKTHAVLTARHTGPCRPGQRPGDMTLPNGATVNMRDAMGGARK